MGILDRLFGRSAASEKSGVDKSNGRTADFSESTEDADQCIAQGQVLEDKGDYLAAELRYRAAISAARSYPRAHLNLGNALQAQGKWSEAVAAHRAALKFDANYFGALYNLGSVLIDLGEYQQARHYLERALLVEPTAVDVLVLLASVSEAEGDLPGAISLLKRGCEMEPDHSGSCTNLALLLQETGDVDKSEKLLQDVLRNEPEFFSALTAIANIKVQSGKSGVAEDYYRRALSVDSSNMALWSSFLFSTILRDDIDQERVAREHFAFGNSFDNFRVDKVSNDIKDSINNHRKIRVGYVSADLKRHPVALFLRPVLACHNREKFEIFCYSNSTVDDDITAELRKSSDHWRVIVGKNDETVADLIRSDKIDLLVDLSGHTTGNRLGVFSYKPARVQASWLGYLNTTGMQAIDFRICDRHTDPIGKTEQFNVESLARLPDCQWCYAPYYDIQLNYKGHKDSGPVVFGSFNQFSKISDASLSLWASVLREVRDSQLRVYGLPDSDIVRSDFYERMASQGIERERISLYGRLGIFEYFAAIESVDIALDSVPYNGATTTLDTLWMGVPVIGLHGSRAISCGAYSILSAAGLTELVAENRLEYIEKNVLLARDADARDALRRSLRERLELSPVMATRDFTRNLESLYLTMLEV